MIENTASHLGNGMMEYWLDIPLGEIHASRALLSISFHIEIKLSFHDFFASL